MKCLEYPIDASLILKKKKALKRELLEAGPFISKNIAILGGSTTAEIRDILELFLLNEGIKPTFYESEYNQYYEALAFENSALTAFKPDLIYIHTTQANILNPPAPGDGPAQVQAKLEAEFQRYQFLWATIKKRYNCVIIQNNFELPDLRQLGNLDGSALQGRTHFVCSLNQEFSKYARENSSFYINDIHYLSGWFGLERWFERSFWYSYRYALSYQAIPWLAKNLADIIKAIYGKSKKCLVLDLDNTLWGGVIGDDGVANLQLGKETPLAEAYTAFQQYLKGLKERGIILTVASKNDQQIAREGFSHPDSILNHEDFAVFIANWEPKPQNILEIVRQLNIGLDSMVFVDDNPVERDLVRRELPGLTVVELDQNVEGYIALIDKAGYFEPAATTADDLARNRFYTENAQRRELENHFTDYGTFLKSLEMKAEIAGFTPVYLERITQLINKTNQFNLTTRRYSSAEIDALADDPRFIKLYGRLTDKYGDNGLITVVIGAIHETVLDIELWVMSCRVLKREMELALFDELVARARQNGVATITGQYYPTPKNQMVVDHFAMLGFEKVSQQQNGESHWRYTVPADYQLKNQYIEVANG